MPPPGGPQGAPGGFPPPQQGYPSGGQQPYPQQGYPPPPQQGYPPPPPAYGAPVPGYGPPPGYQQPYGMATSQAGQPADFLIRLGQYIIDGLVLAIPTIIIYGVAIASAVSSALTYNADGSFATSTGTAWGRLVVGWVVIGLMWFAYEFVTIQKMGATVGMKALGLAVVREEDGGPLPTERLAIRSAFFGATWILQAIPFVGWLVGLAVMVAFLAVLWEPRKQGYHDKFAKALVIRTK